MPRLINRPTFLQGCATRAPLGAKENEESVVRTAGNPCRPGFATLGEAQTACGSSSEWGDCTGITYQAGIYCTAKREQLPPQPRQSVGELEDFALLIGARD